MGRIKIVKHTKTFKSKNQVEEFYCTRNVKEKIRKPRPTHNGYLRIGLTNREGNRKWFTVHRLVAFMFLEYPNIPLDQTPQINHKDEVKTNNRVDNLEWLTAKDNCNYGNRNEKAREKLRGRVFTEEQRKKMSLAQTKRPKDQFPRGSDHHNSRPIVGVNIKTGEIVNLDSIAQADNYFNSNTAKASIGNQLRGKSKTSLGYKWYYKEDYDKLK